MGDDTISSSPTTINQLTTGASASPSQREYEVFLSFSGDTRKNFTDHLYKRLVDSGIYTFRDDPNLERGESIAPELRKAIRESWCSVIVFSKDYASSSWCLDELVEILKQREERGHKVFTVFYHVDPSDLRKQTGTVEVAFARLEDRFDQTRKQSWRNALIKAAGIVGEEVQDRYESKVIDEIVQSISIELTRKCSSCPNNLIGIKSRWEEMLSKLRLSEDDVRIVGICGMGGIGKTALAKVLYTQMPGDFHGKCFLDNVRENSMKKSRLVSLQKQLLSAIFPKKSFRFSNTHDGNDIISRRVRHRRVLVVIDDVDNIEQLDCLAKDRGWFHSGSRIIVTSRNEQLLRAYGVDDVCKLTKLSASESLELLSLKAFNSFMPKNELIELSKSIVEYADGVPLALEVLGLYLCGRKEGKWRSAIERFKSDLIMRIHDCLRISYDGLEETDKNIFLDIAHKFFEGKDEDFVAKILDGCQYQPDIGLDELIKRSLITIEDNRIWMHKLLQEMGRKIVRDKSPKEPGKRCRVTEERDVYQVLTENSGTKAIEGMVINKITREQNEPFKSIDYCAFTKMKKLRLLEVRDMSQSLTLNYLSKELRLFEWPEYPFESLPPNFEPKNLVALLLPKSCIKRLWEECKCLNNLKIVDLKSSQDLIKTPDFTEARNLESLDLEGCTSLIEVHPSIAFLEKLKLLNLRNCRSLKSLPTKIGMKSLEKLILSGCMNLQRFPEIDGKMECLLELHLDGTCIEELPSSFQSLSKLEVFRDTRA